jgi:hypothetical protein
MTLNDARLAFPDLFVPRRGGEGGTGKAKYGAALIITPDHPQKAAIDACIDAAAKAKWGDKAAGILKALRATDKVALHNGDLKAQYAGYEGNLYVSARSDTRPTVFGADRIPIDPDSGKIYAGCYVAASLEFWAQDHKQYGKRVNAQLRGVMFLRDGDAFAAGSAASEDDFADVGDTGDDNPAA